MEWQAVNSHPELKMGADNGAEAAALSAEIDFMVSEHKYITVNSLI